MYTIRAYEPADLAALRHICLVTAAAGKDFTAQLTLPDVVSDIFAVPYTVHDPDLCFVADDGGRAVGYVVGCADTSAFATWFRDEWVPRVAGRYPEPESMPRSWDRFFVRTLHASYERMVVPAAIDSHPSHLHLDLEPEYHRKGLGRRLMEAYLDALRAADVPAVHVSVAAANTGGVAFYERMGFKPFDVPDSESLVWLGRES